MESLVRDLRASLIFSALRQHLSFVACGQDRLGPVVWGPVAFRHARLDCAALPPPLWRCTGGLAALLCFKTCGRDRLGQRQGSGPVAFRHVRVDFAALLSFLFAATNVCGRDRLGHGQLESEPVAFRHARWVQHDPQLGLLRLLGLLRSLLWGLTALLGLPHCPPRRLARVLLRGATGGVNSPEQGV